MLNFKCFIFNNLREIILLETGQRLTNKTINCKRNPQVLKIIFRDFQNPYLTYTWRESTLVQTTFAADFGTKIYAKEKKKNGKLRAK